MKRQDIDTMTRLAQPLSTTATRAQILTSVATMIAAIGPAKFKSLHDVEFQSLATLRAAPIAGTVFEPVATALSACGIDAGRTVGGCMDALNLTQAEVNELACYCHNGDEISGEQTAANLRALSTAG